MIKSKGYAGFSADTPLKLYDFMRRDLGEHDVHITIQYCGICHSDIHSVRNEWRGAVYPMVPGHEIVGVVAQIGAKVTKHKVGDKVGVGCMVGSCGQCTPCKQHTEQRCEQGVTLTYNSLDADGQTTKGGYSNNIVVPEHFVLSVPSTLNLAAAAPLLCAGITTYSPLKHWQIGHGHKVGIIGLGGLGHMGVKFARAFGAEVVVFTSSPEKKEAALKMGAHDVVFSKDPDSLAQQHNSFDFILDTVSARHDVNLYLDLLKPEKTLCMLGISPEPHSISAKNLIFGQKNLSGSLIGGIAQTQEMLNYCGQHHIECDIEMIPIQQVNAAYERILRGDVQYRFVIDMQSLA
jgi:uncharacterized zinc-type alcohol dehydrogenase-like protein